jgi:hypothetical protein
VIDRIRIWVIRHEVLAVCVAALIGAAIAGAAVAIPLTSSLSNKNDDLESVRTELSDTRSQLSLLKQRLEAELGISGELPTAQSSGSGPGADYALGEAGIVGEFIFKPTAFDQTAFEQTGASGGEATYVATISVKNDTSEPQDPFCGDDGAAVMDELGQRYDGDSVRVGATSNCGDSLRPGRTADNYQMEFTLPADAKPAVLELWGDLSVVDESDARAWAVG